MAELLKETYELLNRLGSGGGGIVYLGKHLRLDKLIVLKEDKGTIGNDLETLRREVDSLKNLSHQYIPQVYDFFIENEKVYTVMDYIEGKSFDKHLEKKVTFTQAQVVKWGQQLLQALDYLHSQQPKPILHADIKPSNIMLTTQGDIRLIDFNIALILSKDRSIVVGRSFGYASPEHYGFRYERTKKVSKKNLNGETEFLGNTSKTESLDTEYTELLAQNITECVNGETEMLMDDATEVLLNGSQTEKSEADRTEILGSSQLTSKNTSTEDGDKTAWQTEALSQEVPKSPIRFDGYSYSSTSGSKIILDVRSDIYGLGATLYHLLSGECPAKDAPFVRPLDRKKYSRVVIDIIEKAMNPDPDLRYQSAAEMLKEFQNIKKNDPRTKRLRAITVVSSLLCIYGFLLGGYYTYIGMTRMEATQSAKVLAEYSANALAEGNVTQALDYALQSLPAPDGKFVPEYTAEGQFALSQALGLYEFYEGYQVVRNVTMESEILGLDLTSDGKTAAILTLGKCTLIETETGETLAEIATVYSALAEIFFVDNKTLFVAGEHGVLLYDCESFSPIWTGELGTRLAISGNGEYFASVYKDENHGFVYYKDGTLKKRVEFGDYNQRIASNDLFANPHDNLFAINNEGSLLAISFEGGGLWVFDSAFETEEEKEDFEFFDVSDFTEFSGGFHENYFAVTCTSGDGTLFVIFDTNDWTQTGGFSLTNKIVSQVNQTGIYLQTDNIVVKIHPVTGEQEEIAYTGESSVTNFYLAEDGHALVLTEDFGYSFFDPLTNLIEKKMEGDDGKRYGAISNESALMGSLDSNLLKILSLENYPEQQFGSYDSYFEHLEARVTEDEERLVLFNLEEIQVFDLQGNLQGSSEIPKESGIYDQQFRREEGYLEIIYYDGTRSHYSDEDGTFLEFVAGTEPDYSLEEWFETENYRIFSPLHGNPEVYDRNSDTPDVLAKYIEVPDYLTYVTEIGEQILLEFLSTDGARYGLLCDENLEMIAKIPNLADYKDGYFYFDEGKGNIKRDKIYSLEEMLMMAKGRM